MKHIKSFKLFESSNNDTLYIFDFDDTIVDSPRFQELVIRQLRGRKTKSVEFLLRKSLELIGKSVDDLIIDNSRIYILDAKREIEVNGNWKRVDDRVYLVTPENFYYSAMSFPDSKKRVTTFGDLYKSVKNKAIITARNNELHHTIEDYLEHLGLGLPNWGLFCFDGEDDLSENISIWKAEVAVNLIRDSGFKVVKFYDDKPENVDFLVDLVRKELPDVDIEGINVEPIEMSYLENYSNLPS